MALTVLRAGRALLMLAALVGAVACGASAEDTGARSSSADAGFDGTIRFGVTVSSTGRYALEGRDVRQGYDLWLDWVNNDYGGIHVGNQRYRAEIVYYDDESDPGTTAVLTERLITRDGVDFLLGPFSSRLNASASAIAERHGTILVTGNAASDSLFERGFRHFFSVMTVASRYTELVLDELKAQGARTVTVAYSDTDFPIDSGEGAVDYATAIGMDVLAVETYPRTLSGVSGIIAKFRSLDPDVFVGTGHHLDALLFVRAAEEQGFSPKAMILTVAPSNPAFADELGEAAELVIGPTQWEASMQWQCRWFGSSADYAARYSSLYGQAPTYHAADASAAALALPLAIEAAGTTETEAVRQALLDLNVHTFFGPINFDEQGRNWAKPMGAIQIQKGGLELITPAPMATAELIYPRGEP